MIKRPIKSDTEVTCCCLSVYVCFSVVVIFSLFIAAICSCQGSIALGVCWRSVGGLLVVCWWLVGGLLVVGWWSVGGLKGSVVCPLGSVVCSLGSVVCPLGSVRVHCRSIVGSSGVRWGWVCSIVMNIAQVSIWLKDFAVLLSISVFEKFCATLNITVQHLEEKQNRSICSSHWGNPEVLANFARESTIILQLTAIGRENGNLKPGNLKP